MPNDSEIPERYEVLQLNARIDSLQEALLKSDPMMAEHLKHVHKLLREFDDLPHIMTDEQRATYIAGLKKYRQVELVKAAIEKKSSRRKFDENDI